MYVGKPFSICFPSLRDIILHNQRLVLLSAFPVNNLSRWVAQGFNGLRCYLIIMGSSKNSVAFICMGFLPRAKDLRVGQTGDSEQEMD